MKKILGTLAVTLSLAAWGTQALAGGPHGHGHQPRASTGYHQRSSDWLGPLIVLGIASAAISAAAQPSYSPPPQVTYVTPQVTYTPAAPPPGASFFCSSVGQFYPHTNYCPEGWQMVVPR